MASRSDPAATNMLLGVPYYPTNILLSGSGLLEAQGQIEPPVEPTSTTRRKALDKSVK